MLCVPPAVGVVVTSVSMCATFVVLSKPRFFPAVHNAGESFNALPVSLNLRA